MTMKTQKIRVIDYGQAHLTAQDIEKCRNKLEDLIIAPYDSSKAKGTGYNLSLSEMIYSITRNRLVPICRDSREIYFFLQPNETILALSYEYIKTSNNIAGAFHSRVRVTAQGIGNISTTLDPGWNGMLLFSLNNPTRKKIKVIITSRVEGMMKPNPVITLIPWRTVDYQKNSSYVSDLKLNLDNPPMRIDIWAELASKPLRIFRNRQYQEFCCLVSSISNFQIKNLDEYKWTDELLGLLIELEIGIKIKKEKKIKEILIRIKKYMQQNDTVSNHISILTAALNFSDIVNYCDCTEYLSQIELFRREIQYQLLCGQVEQIHSIVKKHVPTSWRKNVLANIWHFIFKNLGFITLTIISVFLISYGKNVDDSEYWSKLVLTLAPLAISIAYSMLSGIKNG